MTMDTRESYTLRPKLHTTLRSFLIHHNPFYLLSALCMIAGCYALNGALELKSGELPRLMLLAATLNLYELLLIGLGLYLIRRLGLNRDGRTLLLLDAVFLLDWTFLNSEAATADLRTGLLVNAAVFALAVLKVGVVLGVLSGGRGGGGGTPFPLRRFIFVVTQLAVLFGVPCALKWVDTTSLAGPATFYGAWWAVGLLPVFRELQTRLFGRDAGDGDDGAPVRPPGVARDIGRVYTVVPYLSLLAHLGMMHWVYRVAFHPADLAPVMLGLAVAVARRSPSRFLPASNLAVLRVALPSAAVLLSLGAPAGMEWTLGAAAGRFAPRLHLTPAVLAGAAAYLAYVYLFLPRWAPYALAGGAVAAGAYLFGPTPAQVLAAAAATWALVTDVGRRLVPKSAGQWGVVAVAASFAFLALGAACSLKKGRRVGG